MYKKILILFILILMISGAFANQKFILIDNNTSSNLEHYTIDYNLGFLEGMNVDFNDVRFYDSSMNQLPTFYKDYESSEWARMFFKIDGNINVGELKQIIIDYNDVRGRDNNEEAFWLYATGGEQQINSSGSNINLGTFTIYQDYKYIITEIIVSFNYTTQSMYNQIFDNAGGAYSENTLRFGVNDCTGANYSTANVACRTGVVQNHASYPNPLNDITLNVAHSTSGTKTFYLREIQDTSGFFGQRHYYEFAIISGLEAPLITDIDIISDYNYTVNKSDSKLELFDQSVYSLNLAITDWLWESNGSTISTNQDYNYAVSELTDYNICLTVDANSGLFTSTYCEIVSTGDWTAPTTTFTDNGQIPSTANHSITLTCVDNNSGCEYINFSINGGDYNNYLIGDNPLNLIISGIGNQNISYFSSDFNDNNEAIQTNDFNTYGVGRFYFYDDANAGLTGMAYTVTPSINGVSSGTLTDINLDLNFEGITNQAHTFNFSKADYTTKNFSLDINEFSDFNYPFVVIATDVTSSVNFQVFNESGATANNTTFTAFDYDLLKYVDIQTTSATGLVTFNLNETKSDYNFFSETFNFGTTVWHIAKPKDAITLVDISGNWKYSITGASYSSQTNIVAGVQKLLLQNTVNPYYMLVQDVAETYAPANFGLQSITTEDDKNLNPYLYLYSQADLKLIKLLRYSTNIPISEPHELTLSVYTDSNGLIQIGTFINDSTGTYNIYMDSNALYRLEIDTETFELNPTLGVYYVYLSQDIGLDYNLPSTDTNNTFADGNFPTIFLEMRQYAFGCSVSEPNCYESATFAIIAMILLTIVFISMIPTSPLQQTVISATLLSLFTAIGFVPLWLFGITIVIIIAWGVYS